MHRDRVVKHFELKLPSCTLDAESSDIVSEACEAVIVKEVGFVECEGYSDDSKNTPLLVVPEMVIKVLREKSER